LMSSTHLGLTTRFLLMSDGCGFVDVGRSFWREDGSIVYICCWSSPEQSFLGLSPSGLVTIFYCLRFETPPTWRARYPYLYPQEQSDPVIPPDTGFPFRRLLRLAGLWWRYSNRIHAEISLNQSRSDFRTQSQSQSYVTTDGQSASLSYDQILIIVWHIPSCPSEGALSDERTGLSFVSQPAVLGQLSVWLPDWLLATPYIVSGRTTAQKTQPLPSNSYKWTT
jgi:hypothetical protein